MYRARCRAWEKQTIYPAVVTFTSPATVEAMECGIRKVPLQDGGSLTDFINAGNKFFGKKPTSPITCSEATLSSGFCNV